MTDKKKPIRLYLAILNHGWLRREIVQKVLPMIRETEGVEVVQESFSKSWAEPIFSNRNRIAKRFIDFRPKCDFLLMMDDDCYPKENPAELVYANKDIVSVATKVRQQGRVLNWNAYMKHPILRGYSPVDFSRVDSDFDLLQVDAVGTGIIMIKRKVLVSLFWKSRRDPWETPFAIRVKRYGVNWMGTDIAFSERAREAGFEIFTTIQRWGEHYKEVGLLDMTGYDDSDFRDSSPQDYNLHWGEWQIQQRDWKFIKRTIGKYKVKNILEFGSGLSSLLMSEKAKVISYEMNPKWKEKVEELANHNGRRNNLEIRLWDGKNLEDRTQYDLAFVDGPAGILNGGIGREKSIFYASCLAKRVIIHDAGRNEEQRFQNMHLRGEFALKDRNGNHQQRCQLWIRKT